MKNNEELLEIGTRVFINNGCKNIASGIIIGRKASNGEVEVGKSFDMNDLEYQVKLVDGKIINSIASFVVPIEKELDIFTEGPYTGEIKRKCKTTREMVCPYEDPKESTCHICSLGMVVKDEPEKAPVLMGVTDDDKFRKLSMDIDGSVWIVQPPCDFWQECSSYRKKCGDCGRHTEKSDKFISGGEK